MSLREKIKHGWGYELVAEPDGSGAVLQNGQIAHWPTNNPPTIAEIESVQLPPNYQLQQLRNAAKAALADAKAESALLRAAMLVIVDEFNNHADKTNAILTAIDNATSLANLKTAIAAIADLPQRNGAQLRAAANNKLDSGDADT